MIDPTPKSAARLLEAFDRSRYYVDDLMEAVRRREMAYLVDTESGSKADLIVRKDRPFSRAEFGRRQAAEIGGMEVFGATAEDTVLAKLEWRARSGSEQQLRDVVAILSARTPDIEYLRHWAAELGIAEALEEAMAASGH